MQSQLSPASVLEGVNVGGCHVDCLLDKSNGLPIILFLEMKEELAQHYVAQVEVRCYYCRFSRHSHCRALVSQSVSELLLLPGKEAN